MRLEEGYLQCCSKALKSRFTIIKNTACAIKKVRDPARLVAKHAYLISLSIISNYAQTPQTHT